MTFDRGDMLAGGGFVEICRRAVIADDVATLERHAEGVTDEIDDIVEKTGAGDRARAIAHLAAACAPSTVDRAAHVREAVRCWSPDAPSIDCGELRDVDQVAAAVRAFCHQNLGARLVSLDDLVSLLRGAPAARSGKSAAVTLPTAENATGRLLTLSARSVEGALPGVYEDVDMVLAYRGRAWRTMERAVDGYIFERDNQAAIRYRLTDSRRARGGTPPPPFVESVDGKSAGLALAVAARACMRGRLRISVSASVALSGAIGPDGSVRRVDGLEAKLSPGKLREDGEQSPEYLKRVRHLIVAPKQLEEMDEWDARPDGVSVRPAKTVDAALKIARRPLKVPVGASIAAILAIALVWAIFLRGDNGPDRLREARAALPGKVEAAVGRLQSTDPDLGDLLRVELAVVQPDDRSIGGLIDVYRRAGTRAATLRPEQGGIHALAFSPDDQVIAAGGGDGSVTRFDAISGRQLRHDSVSGLNDPIVDVRFSPDEQHVVYGSLNGHLRVADFPHEEEHTDFTTNGPIASSAFAQDLATLLIGGRGQLGTIAGPDFKEIAWHSLGAPSDVVFSIPLADPDRPLLCVDNAAGGREQFVAFDPVLEEEVPITRARGGGDVECPVVPMADGRLAAVNSAGNGIEIGSVRHDRWHVAHAGPRVPWTIEYLDPGSADRGPVAAGGNRLAILSAFGRARHTVRLPDGWSTAQVSTAGDRVAIVREARDAVVGPVAPGTSDDESNAIPMDLDGAETMVWAADSNRVVVGGALGNVALVDVGDRSVESIALPFNGRVRAVAIDRTGRVAWAGGDEGEVARIDLTHPDAKPEISSALGPPIRTLALSEDEKSVAVGGFANTGVRLLDATNLVETAQASDIDASALTWVGKRRLLVASGVQNGDQTQAAVRVMDTQLKPLGKVVEVPGAGFLDLKPKPGDPTLVAAAGTTDAVIDAHEPTPRVVTQTDVTGRTDSGVAWTPDGAQLIVTGDDGIVVLRADQLSELGRLNDAGGGRVAGRGGQVAWISAARETMSVFASGVPAWSQAVCTRLHRFLSPQQWIRVAGPLPVYKRACRPPGP